MAMDWIVIHHLCLRFYVEALTPSVMVFGEGVFGKVGPPWRGKDQNSLLPPTMWGHNKKAAVCKPGRESSKNPTILVPWSRTSASRTVRNQFLWSKYPIHGIWLWQPKLIHSSSCIHKICIFCCNVKFLLISTIKNAFMKAFTIMAITKKRAEILGAQHEITFESFNCFQSLYIVEFSFLKNFLKGFKFRSEACIYMHKLPKSQRLFFFLRAKGTLEFNRNRWLIALGKWQ